MHFTTYQAIVLVHYFSYHFCIQSVVHQNMGLGSALEFPLAVFTVPREILGNEHTAAIYIRVIIARVLFGIG